MIDETIKAHVIDTKQDLCCEKIKKFWLQFFLYPVVIKLFAKNHEVISKISIRMVLPAIIPYYIYCII